MVSDRSEYVTQIRDLTPDRAYFSFDVPPELGERIIAYIEEIGRVEGEVTDIDIDAFLVKFTIPSHKREKIAAKLSWLQNRDEEGSLDQREHLRYEPSEDSSTMLTMPDGRKYECEILDISLSGAAVKASVLPSIGTQIVLGKTPGTVVRVHECGVGIRFSRMLEEPDLENQIA
ncbi:MAG: PilZ domain-containing protein [Hyphomicrobiales bacterium]